MRRSFLKQEIQRWTLIDLNPWQECLVRYQLQLWNSACESRVDSHDLPVEEEQTDSPMQTSVAAFSGIDADDSESSAEFLTTLQTSHVLLQSVPSSHRYPLDSLKPDAIRLLWDWGPSKLASLRFASEAGFHGVIRDPVSLRSWIRVCSIAGMRAIAESHPILSKVSIPGLLPRNGRLGAPIAPPAPSRSIK